MSSVSSQNMRMRSNTVWSVAVAVLLNLTGSFGQQHECGRAPLKTKIFGGVDAAAGSWPWQVHITYRGIFYGGSLIDNDWVLTTASCASNNMSVFMIYLGRQRLSGPNPHEVNRTVIQVIIHPNYNTSTFENNIALLRLSSSVNFTDYIKPVCLAAAGSVFDQGLSSWVAGWGVTQNNTFPDILQEVEISTVSNYNCSVYYDGLYDVTNNMMCAGPVNVTKKGPCWGDIGAPLVSKQGSRWIQSGIVSFGFDCGHPLVPIIYTRVSQYQDWITSRLSAVGDKAGFVIFPDTNIDFVDIFSGSACNLCSFLLYLTFSIISLIFCPYF